MIRNPFGILAAVAESLGVDERRAGRLIPAARKGSWLKSTSDHKESRRSKVARKQQKRSRRANR